MVKKIILKKSSYESAKISVKKSKLYSTEKILELSKLSFEEILKYMEENDFRNAVDSSYLQFEGFYLIEKVLNMHNSRIYGEIFKAASKNNRLFLDNYYLKYQIHNLMALIRCKLSNEDDLEVYLIGDERKKSKFLKAYEMQNIEDSIEYISKKLKFNYIQVLENYKLGIFYLENYLYQNYYKNLFSNIFSYNNVDEIKFFNYLRKYIDLLNFRIYLRLKNENNPIDFKNLFIFGGKLNYNFFENLNSENIENIILKLDDLFGKLKLEQNIKLNCISNIDNRISLHKRDAASNLKSIKFGSPLNSIKYLFDLEEENFKLRILLKGKYMKLEEQEILSLIKN